MTQEIRIICTAPTHVGSPDAFGTVTVVNAKETAWAFCPSAASDGHRWEQAEARPIELLRYGRAHLLTA